MRRLVAAIAALALALSLTACGGGGAPSATTTTSGTGAAAAPAVPPPSAAGVAAVPVVDNSPTETVTLAPLQVSRDAIPSSISQRLESGQPMLILFFDPHQQVTDDVRAEVDAVIKKYRGTIDVVSFDVSKTLTPKGAKDPEAQRVSLMTSELSIRVTPYIILVDQNGLQVGRHAGFVDRAILEKDVIRATN